MTGKREDAKAVTVGEKPVSLAGIIAVARRGATVVLSGKAAFRKRIESSRRLLQKAIEADSRSTVSPRGTESRAGTA